MNQSILADNVYWVGAIDFDLRSFHHYSTSPRGSTYNAYFIDDEKKTLIDTVSHKYFSKLCYHLDKYLPDGKLDYIICQHMEQDHSGTLPQIVKKYKPDVIYCSKLGLQSLKGQVDTTGWNIQTVADGETINLGKKNITFYETRMLHWPDSMVSYLHEDKILFTNDIFGQNIACTDRYTCSQDKSVLYSEMKSYYGNIILPYSNLVLKALEKIQNLNVEIDILAPDHGLMFKGQEQVSFAINAYKEFAEQAFMKSALIVYDSMWQATEKMAQIIGETLIENDIPYTIVDVQKNHVAEIMNRLMDASILLLGSPTRNNLPMTAMMALMNHIKGLAPKNRYGATFGSYGWSGEAPKILNECLEDMKFTVIAEPLRLQYGLSKEQEDECKVYAQKLADAIHAISGANKIADAISK